MNANDKTLAACLAMFVADAAGMPVHWIYDAEKLKQLLENNEERDDKEKNLIHCDFFPNPSCPYYNSSDFPGHYSIGDPSPYGEEAYALFHYMKEANYSFESGQQWAEALQKWASTFTGRKNSATKMFEENMEKTNSYPSCGADDSQANVFFKVPLIATRYVGTDEYLEKVEQAIRAHQNTDEAVAYGIAFAKMLQATISGSSLEESLNEAKKNAPEYIISAIEKGWQARNKSTDPTGAEIVSFLNDYKDCSNSRSCGFPQSFVVSIKILGDCEIVRQEEDNFCFSPAEYAIRRNIQAGGDCCGRSPIVGAMMAAVDGLVPGKMADKLSCDFEKLYGELQQFAKRNSQE